MTWDSTREKKVETSDEGQPFWLQRGFFFLAFLREKKKKGGESHLKK